jgi:UDP-N-acetylglucosamine--N-acetylmuramyl-(pentapeptide) pyrophosphoryl-undecaprenol N-acetylglucosamine transferase
MIQSLIINLRFKPKVAIGSGGYVAGPAIWGSSVMGAKVILLEQNSYPGVTTKLLEKYASEIHLGFEDSAKYFKNKRILNFTGNPVRKSLVRINRETALKHFGLNPSVKTIFILGGSLGAASINQAVEKFLNDIHPKDINIIWQTGKNYYENYKHLISENIIVKDFIDDMNLAYSACDLLVSRAGATTIAEILVMGIAAILIPSPNVAENHQYYNAKSLSDRKAAILIEDNKLAGVFETEVMSILNNDAKLIEIRINAANLGRIKAAEIIAEHAIEYCK